LLGAERRLYPRLEIDLPCVVDGTTEGRIRNISAGGALLVGPVGLAGVADVLSVEIQRGNPGPLELFSDVVRVLARAGSGEYGLRFVLAENRREALDTWMEGLPGKSLRRVKGALFVDYVRMMRSSKGVDWSTYLAGGDEQYLEGLIDPNAWYPMGTFERMGLAILREVAQGNLVLVRAFGRDQLEGMTLRHPELVAPGDPRDSLMRFQVLQNTFFDYPAVEILRVSDGQAAVSVRYGMGQVAEEAASLQAMGFFERLIELSGGADVQAWFSAQSWKGAARTVIELRWGRA
jgi:hypothetical protein